MAEESKSNMVEPMVAEAPYAANNSQASDMQSNFMSMVPIVLIFLVMYFLLIRPQDKKRRQHEEMIKSAKKGDLVITVGGIYGIIVKIDDKDNTIMLEIAKDSHIKIAKSAIVEFVNNKKEITKTN